MKRRELEAGFLSKEHDRSIATRLCILWQYGHDEGISRSGIMLEEAGSNSAHNMRIISFVHHSPLSLSFT